MLIWLFRRAVEFFYFVSVAVVEKPFVKYLIPGIGKKSVSRGFIVFKFLGH